MNSNQKVALITGSAKRIGATVARYLHANNMDVVLHYRHSADAAKSLRDDLNQIRPHSCIALHADLANPDSWQHLAQQAQSWKQRVDVLVNNASTYYPTTLENTTVQQWNDLFASNAQAPFFLTQALLPALKQQKGCVINIVDALVDKPDTDYTPYTMAKSALRTMTLSLAKMLAPDVRVNGIAPGAILWPEHAGGDDENLRQKILNDIPMQEIGTPEDIAKAILFLVADAPYVTGQILAVDGGRSL
ncbi:pteridine reductase [Ketobacter sp. MCCC 1A13808]|uniref:pteridine reductase n=1 Tax=Ketobacter sp. MCCC 1A13808 TaxID=2602738 RepID=UPI000F15BF7B|nr:pteridine reductase [Ketobacter sp. MCCC 1A13808]MVF13178.1 pteridine reductase [Ketobacter sp. MCCC 1A13808]RLP52543.1 MAG: pteridine reductase [Ketobacter sp.]